MKNTETEFEGNGKEQLELFPALSHILSSRSFFLAWETFSMYFFLIPWKAPGMYFKVDAFKSWAVPFPIYNVPSWDFLALLNMKCLGRKVCQLVSIKAIALLASRMLHWSPSSWAFLSWRLKPAECILALMYPQACWSPKCINSHKVAHSRSLWAGVEALLEILLQIFRLAVHPQGTYSMKSEARRPLNKPINYVIINCDACGLVTGALSENRNNLLLK